MTKTEVLKTCFGHSGFREGQEEIVDSLLSGRDALCVMPTGAGKSICYQLPALMLPGVTLVISPLISLMKDQVNALTQAGVRAAYINSSLTSSQYNRVIRLTAEGAYKIVYVAPERLEAAGFFEAFSKLRISLVAVDEAHCVSQWGQDFRPSYLKIVSFIENLPYRPAIGAFTATATERVKADIARILRLEEPYVVTTGFDRPNLYFGVRKPKSKSDELLKLLSERRGRSGIVYCATRKAVEEVCELLNARGVSATRYHAGLSEAERKENQEDFVYDRKAVMVATNAFGMGIDKSNVSFVIHYNMPKDIESYYQEAGRAGRDGGAADCILLYSPRDVRTAQFLIENSEQNPEFDEEARRAVREKDLERLKYMTFYCTTGDCLRAYILKYFGERSDEFCGSCSNCATGFRTVDITLEAQKILSCCARTGQRFGMKMIVDILRGSKSGRIVGTGLDRESTYGLMADVPEKDVRRIVDALINQGFATVSGGQYPVMALTEKSADVLYRKCKVEMRVPAAADTAHEKKRQKKENTGSDGLLAELKKLRARLAAEAKAPAYVVFTDAALSDMCQKLPGTDEEFLAVSGVGKRKLERYGADFLRAIAEYRKMHPEN